MAWQDEFLTNRELRRWQATSGVPASNRPASSGFAEPKTTGARWPFPGASGSTGNHPNHPR